MTKHTSKTDIYQSVTDNIIDLLETVNLEDYQPPFAQLASQKLPLNPTTSKLYNGINTLVLWINQHNKSFASNEWATFRQWKEKGAFVQKGEQGSSIIYYRKIEKKDESSPEDGREIYNLLKQYTVFNADQVEGYEPTTDTETRPFGQVESITTLDKFIKNTQAIIETDQTKAYYNLLTDRIGMPSKDVFYDNTQSATENYYAVLLHELTHWTGGKQRLNREQTGNKNSPEYAFEELIAELGSAYLCAQFDIKQHARDDHAIYIKSWLTGLKNNKKMIFQAAAQAQRASDYLNSNAILESS